MAHGTHKRVATTAIQSRSKRTRNQDEEGDPQEATTHSAPRKSDANDEEIIEESNEQDGADSFSSRAISELETDITAFIRNTGKNDGWHAAFKAHVRERENGLLEKLRSGSAQREQAEESFQATFLPFLAGCLARVGVRPPDPQRPFQIPNPSTLDQPLFMKSSTLITESNNLLKEYSDLANLKVDTSARDKLLTTLAKEEVAIEKAIKAGRRVAQAEINALLGLADEESMEDSKQGSDVLKLGAQEAQAKARTRGETAESRKTESWAVVAAESVKAFGKMTKVVGGDEMEE